MVLGQLIANRIGDPAMLRAIGGVKRELFLPERLKGRAYADESFRIDAGRVMFSPRLLANLLLAAEKWSAVALREHGFGVANLMEQSYTNPETLKLADRVTCEIDPDVQALFPQKRGAKVRIELKDGTVYEKELYDLKGSPNNPVSTEELKRKFMSNAKAAMPEERAERLLVLLAELEQFERVDALVELLG